MKALYVGVSFLVHSFTKRETSQMGWEGDCRVQGGIAYSNCRPRWVLMMQHPHSNLPLH
jgi:hypothetical protein